tara:strand:- start:5109 stop:6419 length:1311 start_codon:yes stop_codon:yes gene_type:complete
MNQITVLTPQRVNLSMSNAGIVRGDNVIKFTDSEDKEHLKIELTYNFKEVTVTGYRTEYSSLKKILDKRFLFTTIDSVDFESEFKMIQKRLKECVRKSGIKQTPKPVEIKTDIVEVEVKEEIKTPYIKTETPKVENNKQQQKTVKIERPKAVGLEAQLQDIVFNVLESDYTTQTLQNKMIELGLEPNRTEIVVKRLNGKEKIVGEQHYKFETILQCISAKVNIALVGPAGSGKTTAVRNVADSLELPFYSKSVSSQTGVHEFFGYQDANGKYVRTLFREAYENGGVFLLDEFDAGNPNVLASMNQATANGECAFADGMIKKHEDFVVVMAGNTFGHGATSEYVGRNKIDSATLDRFAFIQFDYDEKLELKISQNKDWCKEVQALRQKASDKKIKTIISPRATFDGEKLLMVGMAKKVVLELIIFKGLTDSEKKLLE